MTMFVICDNGRKGLLVGEHCALFKAFLESQYMPVEARCISSILVLTHPSLALRCPILACPKGKMFFTGQVLH